MTDFPTLSYISTYKIPTLFFSSFCNQNKGGGEGAGAPRPLP